MSGDIKTPQMCKHRLFKGWDYYPCNNKATRDGYCGIHHPNAVKRRKEKSQAKYGTQIRVWELKKRFRDLLDQCAKLVAKIAEEHVAGFSASAELREEAVSLTENIKNVEAELRKESIR